MSFVYINPGYYNFFDAYTDGQNLKDTSIVATNGGQCFRGGTTTSTYTYIVNLPAAKEYWARFDLNRYNNNNTSGGDNTYIQFADEKNYRMGIETYSVKDTICLQKNEGSISNTKTLPTRKIPRRHLRFMSSVMHRLARLNCIVVLPWYPVTQETPTEII